VAPVLCAGVSGGFDARIDAPIDTASPARVLLLRHGQSEWNAVRRWQGTADPPLTDLGRRQAIETAWALAGSGVEFTSIWSSDLRRALDTATIIGDALAIGEPTVDVRLREAFAGEWEGMTPDEIEAAYPGWLDAHRRPDSFEPLHEVVDRAVAALRDIARVATGTALVVAHSGVIRSIIRHTGLTDDRVPNLGGIWLTVSAIVTPPQPGIEPVSEIGRRDDGIVVGDLFDPAGIVISGVDAPGEDPGDETDQPGTHGQPEH
jgi:broad specificity phosphatase PhoE